MRYRGHQGFQLGPIGFLIVANLILYLATSVRPQLFISAFGLTPALFLRQPWTIVTNLFIHAPFPSIGHIFGNMMTLYFFGSYLIRLIGERNFWIVYFVGGILGNIFYIWLGPSFIPAVGASGAVFAVAGALTIMAPKMTVFIFPLPVPIPLWIAVIGGFLILSLLPFVAWQAHLGGLAFGLAAGYFYQRKRRFFY